MRNVISCLLLILIMMLTPILSGCDGNRSTEGSEQDSTDEPVRLDPGTSTNDQTGTELPGTVAAPERMDGSEIDPEILVIELLESLGYDRSYLLVAYRELVPVENKDVWNILIEDGFGPLVTTSIVDGAVKPDYVKFVYPTGSLSPALVQPGDDLPERVAGGLGLHDEGYIPAQWVANTDRSEYRKYVSIGEHYVCTHRVVIFIDPETGGLQSIHIAGIDLSPNQQVEIDKDRAVEMARLNIGDPDLDVLHTELIQLMDYSSNYGRPGIYWEITFKNGPVIFINSVDGTVSLVQLGF